MNTTDISLHFTIKGQTIEQIKEKIDNHIASSDNSVLLKLKNLDNANMLHHCFLPEKKVIELGFSNDVYEKVINHYSWLNACWHGVSGMGLETDRGIMLNNLKKLNGLAVFVGEIKEGVLEEFEKAKDLGVKTLIIP